MASVAASGHHAQAGNRFRPCGFHITGQKRACKDWWFQSFHFTNPTVVQNSLANREQVILNRWHMDDEPHTQQFIFGAGSQNGCFSEKGTSNKRGDVSCIHLNHIGLQLLAFGGAAAIQVGCSYQSVRFKSSFSQGVWPHKTGIRYTRWYKLTSFLVSF